MTGTGVALAPKVHGVSDKCAIAEPTVPVRRVGWTGQISTTGHLTRSDNVDAACYEIVHRTRRLLVMSLAVGYFDHDQGPEFKTGHGNVNSGRAPVV